MQTALSFAPSSVSLFPLTKSLPISRKSITLSQPTRCPAPIRASATVAYDASVVDYSSMFSVFPAEACEIIGGDACNAEMYPEVKLKAETRSSMARNTAEMVDREYLEYNSPKTVFLEEACDDLGGEFCQADFMKIRNPQGFCILILWGLLFWLLILDVFMYVVYSVYSSHFSVYPRLPVHVKMDYGS